MITFEETYDEALHRYTYTLLVDGFAKVSMEFARRFRPKDWADTQKTLIEYLNGKK